MFLSSLLFPVVPVLPCSSPFSLLLPPSSSQRYGPGRPDWENHKDKLVNGWDEDARSAFKKLSAEEGAARGAKWTDVSARAARATTAGYDEGAAKAEGKMGGKMGGRGPLAGSIQEARKARKGEALARREREWKREAAEGRKNKKDGKKKKKKKKKDRD